jgi:hypothetical protein
MHCAQEEQATKCGIDTDAVTEQRDSIGAIISLCADEYEGRAVREQQKIKVSLT